MVALRFLQPQKPILVGLDISSSAVKLLELSQDDSSYRVESYAVEPLHSDAMNEREIKDIDAVGLAVEKVVKRSRTKSKFGAIAVAGSSVITKVIQMNASFSENDLVEQINIEAERYIPYPLDEINLDFQVIGPNAHNPDLNDVLLAASRTENIDTLVEVLSIGGLQAKVVDVEAYTIERSVGLIASQLPNGGREQTIAVIDIGSALTTLSVLHDLKTIYTREQMFGGMLLTEEIQRRYGLTYEEAGIAKKQGGLPDEYTKEVLEPFQDSVVKQVNRALQLFYSSSQYNEIDYVILAGGTAALQGLSAKIEQEIKVPCIIANPFANMALSQTVSVPAINADAPSLMICCGLALRSFI